MTLFLTIFWSVLLLGNANGYWLMGANNILTTQRLDPIVNPNIVGTHVHSVVGGSNFNFTLTTESLRNSACTSMPIAEDKSNYWYPHLYFWWKNGSFTSVDGGPVIYYLYSSEPGKTVAFPDEFRMVSGDHTLRTLNASSFAQQAIRFLCLDFEGTSVRYNELPRHPCRSGIRSEINFPSCWDGKNVDSPDHKSHVTFLSTGPDNGTCTDPAFPLVLPRIFFEVYWYTQGFDYVRRDAMDPEQPFVFSNGDPTGYGFHADFFNGWMPGVLQIALDECHCNPYGDPSCCGDRGIFTLDQTKKCFITEAIDEPTLGTLTSLPGNNPVQAGCYEEYLPSSIPALLSPVYVHNGTNLDPSQTVHIARPAQTQDTIQRARGSCSGASSQSSPLTSRHPLLPFLVSLFTVLVAGQL